jgi:hypothetical protein
MTNSGKRSFRVIIKPKEETGIRTGYFVSGSDMMMPVIPSLSISEPKKVVELTETEEPIEEKIKINAEIRNRFRASGNISAIEIQRFY